MPEGHTIHRLARDHRRWFAGRRVSVASPQGRFAAAARLLDDTVLVRTDAHGKHLFHHYEDGRIVHIHLGLFGKVFHHPGPSSEPRPTSRYRVATADHCIDLVGATACELSDPDAVDALVARLGPDPIRRGADPDRAWAALQRRTVPIGRALLDQSVLAGVGNVYRAEVLFVHGIHPDTPAAEISRAQWDDLWATLVSWMRRGVREQRIVTVDPVEAGTSRRRMTRSEATYVYKREQCPRCGADVRRWDLSGRWAYACESCQPRPNAGDPETAVSGS